MEQLDVLLYDIKIATLTLLPGDRTLFMFEDNYIQSSQRPTLSLSFKDQNNAVITSLRPTQTKLPPFFSNLLPEGHLRIYLAAQAKVNPEREFYLLQALGADLPGAVTIQSSQQINHFHNVEIFSEAEPESVLHFSLAGVQMKFSALLATDGGLTIPAHGVGGEWIVKLPSPRFSHVPENEYAMLQLAQAVGIEIPTFELVNINDIRHLPNVDVWSEKKALAIKRFDRELNGKHIHIEDFAQVYGIYPHNKYNKVSYIRLTQNSKIEQN